jgi:putative toxin-antitoxin system antitoxin component (TIGR02293 family)
MSYAMTAEYAYLEKKLDEEVNSLFHNVNDKELHYNTRKKISYSDFLSDKMLIILAIRAGIPYSLFNLIQDYTPFSEKDWANFLDISTKSLQRYRQTAGHHFKPLQSEKIIEVAEVTKTGLEVFGDLDKLKGWLNTPNFALGGNKPLALLKDSYGKDLVLAELTRISHGILV